MAKPFIVFCSIYLAFTASLSLTANAQVLTAIEPDSAKPTEIDYEIRYQEKLQALMNARILTPTSGNAGVDEGKSTWNRLLANIYRNRNNSSWVQNELDTRGLNLLRSQWAGSFCGPFSTVGYTGYYFSFKPLLSQIQQDSVRNNLYNVLNFPMRCQAANGWDLLLRPDGFMDPTVSDNQTPNFNPSGTEFNSENYHWMLRSSAYLFAQEYQDAQYLPQLTQWYKNLTRSIYNIGRIEWNSNNYWGHTFNPLLNLYNFAFNADDRKKAKALLDWQVLEIALHHLDGENVAGADARAKNNAYKRFAGSATPFVFQYFADTTQPLYTPSYGNLANFGNTSVKPDWDTYQGFLCWSKYRPSQPIIDIAKRKFTLPVEIHSAKPFYRADYNAYSDYQGLTPLTQRNEFEFLYLNTNYILNSVATLRPDGALGVFSEQSLWRLGVKGTQGGNIQIIGNSGATNSLAGRWPYEQLGQFRNTLLRVVKNTDSIWIAIPNTLNTDWVGDTLFLDCGNDVYAAFIPYGTLSKTEAAQAGDATYKRITWLCSNPNLSALALEVGTINEFSSYSSFKTRFSNLNEFTSDSTDRLTYNSASGHNIALAYQPSTTYTLQAPRPNQTSVNPAGVLPKLWFDGQWVDFTNWEVYKVVYGEDIISQNRGSGQLELRTQGNGLKIEVDPQTADVRYFTFQESPRFINSVSPKINSKQEVLLFPNPVIRGSSVNVKLHNHSAIKSLTLTDASGKRVQISKEATAISNQIQFSSKDLGAGLYILEVADSNGNQFRQKLIVAGRD